MRFVACVGVLRRQTTADGICAQWYDFNSVVVLFIFFFTHSLNSVKILMQILSYSTQVVWCYLAVIGV